MQPILFALGVFAFVAINLLILRYTTYLSNAKKKPSSFEVPGSAAEEKATSQ
jgi:hypothetical protein